MTEETLDKNSFVQNFREQGIKIIPVKFKSKKPDIPDFANYISGQKIHDSEILPNQNYGVVCGNISDNLVVIDIEKIQPDDYWNKIHTPRHIPLEDEFIDKILPNCINETIVTKTGTGNYHILVKGESIPNKTSKFVYEKDYENIYQIDFKVTGICVEAGSIHENGNPYRMVSNVRTIKRINLQSILIQLEKIGFRPTGKTPSIERGDYFNWTIEELLEGKWIRGERRRKQKSLYCKLRRTYKAIPEIKKIISEINKKLDEPLDYKELEDNFEYAEEFFQKEVLPKWGFDENIQGTIKQITTLKKKDRKDLVDFLAKEVQSHFTFKTMYDNEEIFIYDGKIYQSDGAASMIKEYCEGIVEGCDTRFVNEVVNKIKRQTGTKRELFDNNPDRQTVENGILDISNLKISNHTPNNLSCVKIPCNFIDDSIYYVENDFTIEDIEKILKDTVFLKYLKSCFTLNNTFDFEQFYTVLEICAICLLKTSKFEKAFMFIGSGANGKSVLLYYLINAILGKENVSNITIQSLAMNNFAKAELYNKMANIYPDIESHELSSSGTLKALISGDRITAEKKHRQPFSFSNYGKLIFSANKFPQVLDQTDAFFRRFIIVNWKRQFTGKEIITDLKKNLMENQEEIDKVFNLLVRIAQKIDKRGNFLHQKRINEIRTDWNKHSDPIMLFIENLVESKEGAFETKSSAYKKYCEFCIINEIQPVKITKFGRDFGEYYETTQHKGDDGTNRKCWQDIRVKEPSKQESLDY